ncbi:MAG: endonuclease III [Bacillota bacterium]|nr:endonuclease III [Bacillota bacterium]
MEQKNGTDSQRIKQILGILEKAYPKATTELIFKTPFQLLIATMLSAQTTDRQVNRVTPELFGRYPDAGTLANAPLEEIEEIIRSCGFYKTKAANIKEASRIIEEKYGGQVPRTVEELTSLPGVGRKTANVVVSNAFGVDAIAVDTHVFRVSNRIGLADSKDVEETERQLMERIPQSKWSRAHHWLIHHGRKICSARKPKCSQCPIVHLCSYYHNYGESE